MEHELKTDAGFFQAVIDGQKPFEIRRNDRNYQVGDILVLKETKYPGYAMNACQDSAPLVYTGRKTRRRITYIMPPQEAYGLTYGFIAMTTEPVDMESA